MSSYKLEMFVHEGTQEKREPYSVHFVSANHRYVGQLIPYFTNYLRYAFFLFLQISKKYAKFLAKSIYMSTGSINEFVLMHCKPCIFYF